MSNWEKKIKDAAVERKELVINLNDFVFGEVIGTGGYGKVIKARQLSTGMDCAVKQIYSRKLEGDKMRRYLNEINTMSLADNLFLLNFIGFTAEPPYSIITQYMPNSSLEKYIYTNSNKTGKTLTGSQLTVICLGISYGLMHLHKLNIIHRDLKASNILLDQSFLPKISDFGISRFEDSGNGMTEKIGTPNYMAPELMTSKYYDWKVDVYSFGMLMYEMAEGVRAFKGLKISDIFNYVVNFEFRPRFTNKTPLPLQLLIRKCWAGDPEKRPTFEEIYSQFASGKVAFPDTKRPHVMAVLQLIERDESKRTGITHFSMRKYAEASQWKDYTEKEETSEEVDKDFQPENIPKAIITSKIVKILQDPNNPKFKTIVAKYAKKIGIIDFNAYFSPLYTLLYHQQQTIPILKAAVTLMDRDTTFIYFFDYVSLFSLLPLRNKAEIDLSCECLSFLFTERPFDLSSKHIDLINTLFKLRPKKMLVLHSFYARSFNLLADPYLIIDNLMTNEMIFYLKDVGHLFVSILFYLLSTFPDFVSQRGSQALPIMSHFLLANNKESIISVYDSFSQLSEKINLKNFGFEINYELILKHLNDGNIWLSVVSFLIRTEDIHITPEMLKILLMRTHQSPRPWLVLIKVAETKEGSEFLFEHDEWILETFRHPTEVARIFLILYSKENLHSRILEMDNLGTFLSSLLDDDGNIKLYTVATSIIRYAPHVMQLLNFLSRTGIIKQYITITQKYFKNDEKQNKRKATKIKKQALLFFDTLSRIGYMNEYLLFVDQLCELISDPAFTKDTITVMVSLSQYPPLALAFREKKIEKYFQKLELFPNYKDAATRFLANLNRVVK